MAKLLAWKMITKFLVEDLAVARAHEHIKRANTIHECESALLAILVDVVI